MAFNRSMDADTCALSPGVPPDGLSEHLSPRPLETLRNGLAGWGEKLSRVVSPSRPFSRPQPILAGPKRGRRGAPAGSCAPPAGRFRRGAACYHPPVPESDHESTASDCVVGCFLGCF